MNKWLRAAPMLLCMGAIFFLSHQPGDPLSKPLFPGDDKVAHLICYALLCAAIFYAFPPHFLTAKTRRVSAFAFVIALLFGISDEYHQSFIPFRDASFYDFLADALGAALVCILIVTWQSRKKRKPLQ